MSVFQIQSLECSRAPIPQTPSSSGIACAMKVQCLEKQEFALQNMWIAENSDHEDQSPVEDATGELDLSDKSFAASVIERISSECQKYEKVF